MPHLQNLEGSTELFTHGSEMLFHNPKGAPSNLHCETLDGRAVFFQCIVKLAGRVLKLQCTQGSVFRNSFKLWKYILRQFENF